MTLTDAEWDRRYERYERACAGWGIPAEPLNYWKAYWEWFGGEELAPAPIMVHRR